MNTITKAKQTQIAVVAARDAFNRAVVAATQQGIFTDIEVFEVCDVNGSITRTINTRCLLDIAELDERAPAKYTGAHEALFHHRQSQSPLYVIAYFVQDTAAHGRREVAKCWEKGMEFVLTVAEIERDYY